MRTRPRALVTGASSGIGAAFARALAQRGYDMVLVARRAERLRDLAAELGPARTHAVPLDLASKDAPAELERTLQERGLELDLLVNNAGSGLSGPVLATDPGALRHLLDLNGASMVELTRRLVPPMVQRGRGAVINVVSMSAFQPVPYLAVYAASKAFVLSFTEALAEELRGTGVKVQALCPGNIPTEFQQVAGTGTSLYDRTAVRMRPEQVVARSLSALDRGTLRVIPGWSDRLTLRLQALAPDVLVRRIAGRLFRPASIP